MKALRARERYRRRALAEHGIGRARDAVDLEQQRAVAEPGHAQARIDGVVSPHVERIRDRQRRTVGARLCRPKKKSHITPPDGPSRSALAPLVLWNFPSRNCFDAIARASRSPVSFTMPEETTAGRNHRDLHFVRATTQ